MPDVVLRDFDRHGVATVTLNRPEVGNAYDSAMIAGLLDTMDAIEAHRDVRVVVLQGPPTFDRLVTAHAAKRRSAEAAEGVASFVEKRAARWYPGAG